VPPAAVTPPRNSTLSLARRFAKSHLAIPSSRPSSRAIELSRTLIITADDFGRSIEVNEAVEEAHRRGILTAASLMVAAPAAADAVERARRLPGLGVGLHLTLVDGAPALPRAAIPDLLAPDGRLGTRLVATGIRIACQAHVRRQAEAEIRAQFETFRRTGLALDHVNGHHHYHQHPVVFAAVLRLAAEFGVAAVRVPYEPFLASWRARREGLLRRLWAAATTRRRTQAMARQLRRRGLLCNDAVFGLNDSGRMTREPLLAFLAQLPEGISELYCHPATRRWSGPDAPAPGYDPAGELAALVDPEVIALANRPGIRRVNFAAAR
jgi:hopanoid biosynthesis associated protein HpnK